MISKVYYVVPVYMVCPLWHATLLQRQITCILHDQNIIVIVTFGLIRSTDSKCTFGVHPTFSDAFRESHSSGLTILQTVGMVQNFHFETQFLCLLHIPCKNIFSPVVYNVQSKINY